MTLTFSRRLALVIGISVPIIETIRRWHQLGDIRVWPSWLDDFVLGACLLYGFWRTARGVEAGRPWLAAAWVVGIKGAGFLLALLALAGSLRHADEKSG
jgi:hypothetical protein